MTWGRGSRPNVLLRHAQTHTNTHKHLHTLARHNTEQTLLQRTDCGQRLDAEHECVNEAVHLEAASSGGSLIQKGPEDDGKDENGEEHKGDVKHGHGQQGVEPVPHVQRHHRGARKPALHVE